MAEYLSEEDMNTGEYISRDETLKIFHQCCDNCTSSYNGVMCRACADAGAMDILIDIPAADVQPVVHAYWIELPKALNPNENPCKCSNCGHVLSFMNYYPKSKYCDDCGARMDGDKANNVRNLTDEETEIYESWIDHEAKDTGVNIMDGDT